MTEKEWLGETNALGIDIWNKKYKYTTKSKEENFEEFLDRISLDNKELRKLIKGRKFLFGGRALSNIDTDNKSSFFNCFMAGSKVITKRGFIKIENIKIGDYVITEDNSWQTVNNIMQRDYIGDIYKIQSNYFNNDILCTPNHRFLTQHGWKRADRLEAMPMRITNPDKLKIPEVIFQKEYTNIDLLDYIELNKNQRYEIQEEMVQVITSVQNKNMYGAYKERHDLKTQNKFKRYLELDKDMLYFIGRWLGDGSVTKKKGESSPKSIASVLQIVFNATTEKESAEKIIKIGTEHFGITPNIRHTNQNVISVRWNSETVCNFFIREFGQKCDGKHIPQKYIGDLDMALGLLDSDGYINPHGGIKITLKNKQIIEWLQETLFLNGMPTGKVKDIYYRQKDTYQLEISTGIGKGKIGKLLSKSYYDKKMGLDNLSNYYKNYAPITNITVEENVSTKVYNISVENVHSYTVNGVVVHNCYSRGFILDDFNDILQANTDIALTYKAQGGQGLSLTKLRPKGTPVGDRYQSDGIVPFMRMYNETTSAVSQGGSRKGALMISLDCKHKEVEDFIKIKSNETAIQKANLSLEVDDEFMKAVDKYYTSGEEVVLHESRNYSGHLVEYDVTPIKIFKLLCQNCYDWADPAILYTNRFRNYNLMEFVDDYVIETSNPCVTGDTQVLTSNGYREIKDIVGQNVLIWNGYKFSQVVPQITGKNQEILKIKFSNGSEIKCTPYHKFILNNNDRVKAESLKIGDSLIKCNFPIINGKLKLENAYTQGFFSGDGFMCSDRNAKYISFYGEEKRCLVRYCSTINQRENSTNRETYSINVNFEKEFVPLNNYTIKSKCEWLAGLIDSDGSNNNDGSIAITSVNYKFLFNTKLMLNTVGLDCSIQQCKDECDNLLPSGDGQKKYHCQKLYRLCIAASDVCKLNTLGFTPHRVKNTCIPNRNAKRYISIVSIEVQDKIEDYVYCFTEKDNHSSIFNGVITAQCGEQPLPKHFACNLGSLNLAEFVNNPFTSNSKFDYDDFKKSVKIAIESLDILIDKNANFHPLKEQTENSLNYRNVGLGVFGYADMLMMLQIRYGSKEAQEFTDTLFDVLFKTAVRASCNLAKTKGKFPKYSNKIWESAILKNHFTDTEIEEMKKCGLRNCSLISIAPTGSIATMLGRSGGCEPEFAISYKRKTESLNNGENKYYDVFCLTAQEYLNKTQDEMLPDYFVSSNDINPNDRIEIQAIMQNHVDTAISSTINLPNAVTVDTIEHIYLNSWKKGLKGVTIYRDGCKRSGILTTSNSEKNNIKEKLERGYIIQVDDNVIGRKKKLITGCGSLHCTAYFDPDTGDLLETFFSKGSKGGCNSCLTGISRMISLSARAGVDAYTIADQLHSCNDCSAYVTRAATKHDTSKGISCPVAIGNALIEMYEKNKEELGIDDCSNEKTNKQLNSNTIKNPCPECGEELLFEGGCNICRSCGYSKCS